jgi:uncharacterized tellurite resistance protein B-like protein
MLDPVKLEHFRNLVALSAADGTIEEIERATLTKIASQQEIPQERVNIMLSRASEYAYLIPQNQSERASQLEEMIDLALVDGVLDQAELALITMVAEKLGVSRGSLSTMIAQHCGSSKTS